MAKRFTQEEALQLADRAGTDLKTAKPNTNVTNSDSSPKLEKTNSLDNIKFANQNESELKNSTLSGNDSNQSSIRQIKELTSTFIIFVKQHRLLFASTLVGLVMMGLDFIVKSNYAGLFVLGGTLGAINLYIFLYYIVRSTYRSTVRNMDERNKGRPYKVMGKKQLLYSLVTIAIGFASAQYPGNEIKITNIMGYVSLLFPIGIFMVALLFCFPRQIKTRGKPVSHPIKTLRVTVTTVVIIMIVFFMLSAGIELIKLVNKLISPS